jgi:uncharacterized damage-inducible protein DinB
MNREIVLIAEQLREVYSGDPWFGKSTRALLGELDEKIVNQKPAGQHSILELLWHMITWKEFVLSRLRPDDEKDLAYFETNDWRELDHNDPGLWQRGLDQFHQLQQELVEAIQQQKDKILAQKVPGRNYDYRKLLNGAPQHDIYHLGQIAYVKKLLEGGL